MKMKLNTDGTLTLESSTFSGITLSPESVKELKELLKEPVRIFPDCKKNQSQELDLDKIRATGSISPRFLELRKGGKYEDRGIFLGESYHEKWVVVTDDMGCQVLIPKKDV